MKKILVFRWPQESPILSEDDGCIRINYNGLWVDMKNGRIMVTKEPDDMPIEPATQHGHKLSKGEW